MERLIVQLEFTLSAILVISLVRYAVIAASSWKSHFATSEYVIMERLSISARKGVASAS